MGGQGAGADAVGGESVGVGCAAKMVTGTEKDQVETTPYDAVR